jgi:hypothetical protein
MFSGSDVVASDSSTFNVEIPDYLKEDATITIRNPKDSEVTGNEIWFQASYTIPNNNEFYNYEFKNFQFTVNKNNTYISGVNFTGDEPPSFRTLRLKDLENGDYEFQADLRYR